MHNKSQCPSNLLWIGNGDSSIYRIENTDSRTKCLVPFIHNDQKSKLTYMYILWSKRHNPVVLWYDSTWLKAYGTCLKDAVIG